MWLLIRTRRKFTFFYVYKHILRYISRIYKKFGYNLGLIKHLMDQLDF